jgi:serine/threonine protein kinase/Flp pilus assembly protein TadD
MPAKYPYQVGEEPVPGYRVVKFLGKGNFGEVWHAKAPGGASVALKVIPDLSGKQAHKEFRALGIIKDLHHPNLISINAVWLKDGEGTILDDTMAANNILPAGFANTSPLQSTMVASPLTNNPALCELIIAMGLGHKSLYNRLEECRAEGLTGIPTAELLDYMEESAKAIDYLNNDSYETGVKRAGVQHCDIKPHNILIAGTSAQVCDFGLARVQGEIRATATLAATVAYAPPECLEKSGDPSPATDQYSLAITYYELRTGSLPYEDDSLYQVMQAILAGRLDLSRVTPAEEAVLRKATARDPSQRFASTLTMVKALRRAVEGSDIRAAVPKNRSWPRRVALPIAGVACLGALLWWAVNRQSTAENPAQAAKTGPAQPAAPAATSEMDHVGTAAPVAAAPVKGDLDGSGNAVPPKSPQAYFDRGLAHQKIEQWDEAIDDFKKAIQLDINSEFNFQRRPEPAEAYLARAQSRRERGNTEGARQDCTAVIQQFPQSAGKAYSERGACFRDEQDLSQAIDDLSEAIRLELNNALAYSRRGYVYLVTKEFDQALTDLDKAILIEPNDVDRLNRAIVYSATGKSAKAVEEFTAIVGRDATNAEALYQRGLAYRDQRDYAAAIADFRAALALDPKNADALASLALLLACGPDATNKTAQEAVTLATEACDLSNRHEAMHLDALAAAWAKSGDFDKAVQTAQTAVELAKDSPATPTYEERLAFYRAGKPFVLPKAPAP